MSLTVLQKKLGLPADGIFGKQTFNAAKAKWSLSNNRAIHFFAQCAHESGEFKVFTENLKYSAEGLLKVFPKYFNAETAKQYAGKQLEIASRVYANRMGNGNEASKEGWTYRGRGAIQLTGKDNYKAFSEYMKKPEILTMPDIVAIEYAFESALFFFDKNNLWKICDKGLSDDVIKELTKRINGGTHGLEDRIAKTNKYSTYAS